MDRLGRKLGGAPTVRGSSFQMYNDTPNILSAIVSDVDAAKTSVLMEFYIWNEGGAADEVLESVNLDMRSPWINYEVALFVYEPKFAKELRTLQQTYLEDSDHLDPAEWGARSFKERFLENALRLVSPIL